MSFSKIICYQNIKFWLHLLNVVRRVMVNPFLSQCSISLPLRTSRNLWFSDVSGVIEIEHWDKMCSKWLWLKSLFLLGSLFKVIYSTYDRRTGDRIWEAYCNVNVPRDSLIEYHWTGYQNELYQDFQFTCSNNRVLAGISSSYNNGDRKYAFLCAYFSFKKGNCDASGFTNVGISWTQAIPKDMYLTGIDSIYDYNTK